MGVFAGVVEIVPVIGPLTAGALAVGVGLTESWHLALTAAVVVVAVRLLEDYLVIPNVLGDAVGLSPLVVLVSVTATAILFGGWAVLLAIPLAAVLATLVSVIVLEGPGGGRADCAVPRQGRGGQPPALVRAANLVVRFLLELRVGRDRVLGLRNRVGPDPVGARAELPRSWRSFGASSSRRRRRSSFRVRRNLRSSCSCSPPPRSRWLRDQPVLGIVLAALELVSGTLNYVWDI